LAVVAIVAHHEVRIRGYHDGSETAFRTVSREELDGVTAAGDAFGRARGLDVVSAVDAFGHRVHVAVGSCDAIDEEDIVPDLDDIARQGHQPLDQSRAVPGR